MVGMKTRLVGKLLLVAVYSVLSAVAVYFVSTEAGFVYGVLLTGVVVAPVILRFTRRS